MPDDAPAGSPSSPSGDPAPAASPAPGAGANTASTAPTDDAKSRFLPRKTKLYPWEVESAIPDPGKHGEKLPRILRPAWRLYAYTISTPKRRNFYVQLARITLVVGMILIVTAVIYPELTNAGDPTLAADPLTFTNMTFIPAHNISAYSGIVDGGDEIEGNFTVVSPAGAQIVFDVLPQASGNWSSRLGQHVSSLPGPTGVGPIDFPANYTDWYVFTFTNPNPYPVNVFVAMNYYSSLPPV